MSNEEKFNPQTEPFNILSQPAHPQGEPKTDEEIMSELKLRRENELLKKAFQMVRASERAQIIAEQKTEIPQCLQECKLSFDRKFELSTNQQYSSSKTFVADLVEAEMLEKFSLLLSQVKGLPTLQDYINWWLWPKNEEQFRSNEEIYNWFTEKFSILLLQRDEAHKAEVEKLFNPRPLEEWHEDMGHNFLWWKFPIEEGPYMGAPLDVDWPGYHTHFTYIPDVFLKEKEGQNEIL